MVSQEPPGRDIFDEIVDLCFAVVSQASQRSVRRADEPRRVSYISSYTRQGRHYIYRVVYDDGTTGIETKNWLVENQPNVWLMWKRDLSRRASAKYRARRHRLLIFK